MKRIAPALVALGLFGLSSCTNANPGLVIQGAVPPDKSSAAGLCSYSVGDSSALMQYESLYVNAVKDSNGGEVQRVLGLQVLNTLQGPTVSSPSGQLTSTAQRDDVIVDAADIEADDGSGSKLASETVIANAYMPAGGKGVAVIQTIAKPLADVLNGRSDNFQLVLKVTLHGHTSGGSSVDSAEFRFPLEVRYDQAAAPSPDAGATTDTGPAVGTSVCW